MAHIFIYTVAYLMDLSQDPTINEEDVLKKTYVLDYDVESSGNTFHWISGRCGFYDTDKDNIGKCTVCGAWTTDLDACDAVDTVSYGAKIDGLLYCDEHLPPNHPRAFHSEKSETGACYYFGQSAK